MVEAYVTFVILGIFATLTGCLLWVLERIVPERLQEKFWQKLGLDNNEPYEDYDED